MKKKKRKPEGWQPKPKLPSGKKKYQEKTDVRRKKTLSFKASELEYNIISAVSAHKNISMSMILSDQAIKHCINYCKKNGLEKGLVDEFERLKKETKS